MAIHKKRKNKNRAAVSYLWTGVMVLCALAALFIAIWVVIMVYEKIVGDSSEWIIQEEQSVNDSTVDLTGESQDEERFGWITNEQGSRYRESDGRYAADVWKVWEDKLYYLKEDSYMATASVKRDGQVFQIGADGALQKITKDVGYRGLSGIDNPNNLSSLVKSNLFWAYLSSEPYENSSYFYPIYYRKTAETNELVLGNENQPEISTKNSLKLHGSYIYYLPQVDHAGSSALSEKEKALCNKLFRMKPEENKKELLAEDATGFLILEDGTVYYSGADGIVKAQAGISFDLADTGFNVEVRNNYLYLVDTWGNLVTGGTEAKVHIEDRIYSLSPADPGRIREVNLAEQKTPTDVFTLESQDAARKAIYKRETSGEKTLFAQAPYGIDSFCIAEGYLYYSGVMTQENDASRYSQIYRARLDGHETRAASSLFSGNILNLYYYQKLNKIYGEYVPSSWRNCFGRIAVIDLEGNVSAINDSAARGHGSTDSNEFLELIMADENTVSCYLKYCQYDMAKSSWNILSAKAYTFPNSTLYLVSPSILSGSAQETMPETSQEEQTEPSSPEPETSTVEQLPTAPVGPTQPQTQPPAESPAAPPTAAPTVAPTAAPTAAPTQPQTQPPVETVPGGPGVNPTDPISTQGPGALEPQPPIIEVSPIPVEP